MRLLIVLAIDMHPTPIIIVIIYNHTKLQLNQPLSQTTMDIRLRTDKLPAFVNQGAITQLLYYGGNGHASFPLSLFIIQPFQLMQTPMSYGPGQTKSDG